MEPTNQKHLYHMLMQTIEDLRSKTITVGAASVVSDLAARINTAVKNEHDRVRVIIELENHKARKPDTKAELRNIDGKNFD